MAKEKARTGETFFNFAVKASVDKNGDTIKTDAKRLLVCEQLWASLSNATLSTSNIEDPDAPAASPKETDAQDTGEETPF